MANSRVPGPVCGSDAAPFDRGTLCLYSSPQPGPIGEVAQVHASELDWNDEEGIRIVLTPVQLAAVLSGESIESEPTVASRLWGLGKLAIGALELVGASGLLLVPEPTALTKVAGATLGVHGVDTSASAIRQIASGKETSTFTAEAAQSLSGALGADPKTAEMIGLGADIAIPLIAGGVGALRVIAVRRGAISLAAEEAAGGHTILKHVGRTEAQLRSRLAAEPKIPAASTFRTLADAEKHVGAAIKAHRAQIEAWAKTAANGNKLSFRHPFNVTIGEGVVRSTGQLQQMSKVLVVLRRVQQNNRIYFVLTAFPVP